MNRRERRRLRIGAALRSPGVALAATIAVAALVGFLASLLR